MRIQAPYVVKGGMILPFAVDLFEAGSPKKADVINFMEHAM